MAPRQSARRWRRASTILLVLAVLLIPPVLLVRDVAGNLQCKLDDVRCTSNLKQVGMALLCYQQDHDGTMPPGDVWLQRGSVMARYAQHGWPFVCPLGPQHAGAYGYNCTRNGAAGAKASAVARPEELLAALDYRGPIVGAVPAGAVLASPEVARHNGGLQCLYLDGHVRWLRPADAANPGLWMVTRPFADTSGRKGAAPLRRQPR